MAKAKRRTGPLTMNEIAEYLAIKFEDLLATLPPEERATRVAEFHRKAAEARANLRRAARKRATRAPSRTPR